MPIDDNASFEESSTGTAAANYAVHTLQQTGDSSNRVDIVFVGDGYTASELSLYLSQVAAFIDYLFSPVPSTDPFSLYRNFFNVYAIDVVSQQSGTDIPNQGVYVDTALNTESVGRALGGDPELAYAIMGQAFAGSTVGRELMFALVNFEGYGGSAGLGPFEFFGTFLSYYAAGNEYAYQIALHEAGHSFAGLAEEYWIYSEHYSDIEPWMANSTTDPTGAKWARWLGYVDPILGPIGVYEGGNNFEFGIYKPSFVSKMSDLISGWPFDAIGREAFILRFYDFVDPLDGYDDNSGVRENLRELRVEVIDPQLIHVDWTINGQTFADVGETFDLAAQFGWGEYTVTARAYDPTPWVRADRSSLEQSVTWIIRNDYRLEGTGESDVLTGTDNAQTIIGLSGNDHISGLGGRDMLEGGDGDDTLAGGAGDDGLEGGNGVDTADYSLSSYLASWHRNPDGSWTVTADGEDMLTSVEFVHFADRDVFLDRARRTFSGDGSTDVLFRRTDGVMASWEISGESISAVSFLPSAGSNWTPLATGDISGDGRDDVIWQRNDGLVYAWIMNGGSVEHTVALTGVGAEWSFLGIGDFNGDLTDDFAWQREDGLVYTWSMNSSAIQSAAAVTGLESEWALQGIGDFNGDGRDDFLWRNGGGQTVIWQMDGPSIQASGITSIQAGLEWSVVGIGDTDGDGRDDIVLQRESDGLIAIWAMQGTDVLSSTAVFAADPNSWTVQDIGDFNGDGRDDILWRHDNGLIYLWLLDGASILDASGLAGVDNSWTITGGA